MLAMRAHMDAAAHGANGPDPQTNWIVAEPLQVLARDGIADGSLRDGDPEVLGAVLVNWAAGPTSTSASPSAGSSAAPAASSSTSWSRPSPPPSPSP
jgi:hypothetical protein